MGASTKFLRQMCNLWEPEVKPKRHATWNDAMYEFFPQLRPRNFQRFIRLEKVGWQRQVTCLLSCAYRKFPVLSSLSEIWQRKHWIITAPLGCWPVGFRAFCLTCQITPRAALYVPSVPLNLDGYRCKVKTLIWLKSYLVQHRNIVQMAKATKYKS